jgi:cytochrome P450
MEVELNPGVFSSKAELDGIQLNDISPEHDRPAFVSMDPPEHTGPRRAVAPIANRTSLREYETMIRQRTAGVLDSIQDGETFDWIPKVSIDLTAMMLATMFNFPQERWHELMYWSDVATANLNAPNPLVPDEAARYAVLQETAEAFLPYWDARAEEQGGFDLITMLANDPSTQHMDRAEFIGTLFLLIVGGVPRCLRSRTRGCQPHPNTGVRKHPLTNARDPYAAHGLERYHA